MLRTLIVVHLQLIRCPAGKSQCPGYGAGEPPTEKSALAVSPKAPNVRRRDTPPHLSNLRLDAAVDVTAELSEIPFPTAVMETSAP